jgi:hypothetical protein
LDSSLRTNRFTPMAADKWAAAADDWFMLFAFTGILGGLAPVFILAALGGIGYGIAKRKARHRAPRDQSSGVTADLPHLRDTTARGAADRAARALASARPSPTASPRGPRPDGWAIETHGLTKRFGVNVAVDDVELLVPRGSAFGYLGPNGRARPP